MGRSYGDAAQISGGLVIETTGLKRIEFDAARGAVTAQAGVTIGELLREVVPAGWILPVVPGTQHVTDGGAIASDVHGKNHGSQGHSGLTSKRSRCSKRMASSSSFGPVWATVSLSRRSAGMGLTGIIVDARVKLRPIRGAMLSVDTDRGGARWTMRSRHWGRAAELTASRGSICCAHGRDEAW